MSGQHRQWLSEELRPDVREAARDAYEDAVADGDRDRAEEVAAQFRGTGVGWWYGG